MSVTLIGLAGYSGAGKSSVASYLEEQGVIQRFRFDEFYKSFEDCPKLLDGTPNWETPESMYLDDAYEALANVKCGLTAKVPVYSRKDNRPIGVETFVPEPAVLVEGMLLFADKRIRDLFDVKVWLDCEKDIALARRLARHPELDADYYQNVMLPCILAYLDPGKTHADIVLDGNRLAREIIVEMEKIIHDATWHS